MSSRVPHACVIGWPVGHSRSPLIHNYWLKQAGIRGVYDIRAVAPEHLAGFFATLRDGTYVGCNVTVPHKQAVLDLVDQATAQAKRLKSVNTIYRENGRLVAASSDGAGFIAHLKASVPQIDLSGMAVMLLGAGGAARAIAGALLEEKVPAIMVANRTMAKAEMLARDLGGPVDVCDWDTAARHLTQTGLLVNATSLGMTGMPPLKLDLSRLDRSAVVADIVYAPLMTGLLMEARTRGLATVDGLGMLLHQAAPGFEKWFGVRPAVTEELRNLLIRDIEAAS